MKNHLFLYLVAGLFTINFKREFTRCCCCVKAQWGRKSIMSFAVNNCTTPDGNHRSAYLRTSYSSVRSLGVVNSAGMKISLEKMHNGSSAGPRVSVQYNNRRRSTSKPERESDSLDSNEIATADSRINLNNFIAVQLPDSSCELVE